MAGGERIFRGLRMGMILPIARPDEIGLVDQKEGAFLSLQKVIPYDSQSDWAWIPPLEWSPDSQGICTFPGSQRCTE